MEDLKPQDFKEALNDVRKAHRLIFEYQSRMLDTIQFIKKKLDFPEYWGQKRFSSPILAYKSDGLKIHQSIWAWDFLYSYVFEYLIGEIELGNGDLCYASIVQYSDTGYFDKSDIDKSNTLAFEDSSDSISKLLFVFEIKPKKNKNWIWDIAKNIIENSQYASKNHTKDTIIHPKGNVQIIYSVPLERFINEESTMAVLKEINEYCKEYVEFDIK